jgi:invasion protein IalB
MTMRTIACLPFAAALFATAAQAAQAPVATEVENFGDWTVRCFSVATGGPCDIAQQSTNQQTKQNVVVVSIAYVPRNDRYTASILVPLGVLLPNGVTIINGNYRSKALPFRRCEDDGCHVETVLDPAIIAGLSGPAGKASVTVTSFAGMPIALPLSLMGFTDALDAMKRLAIEKTSVAAK